MQLFTEEDLFQCTQEDVEGFVPFFINDMYIRKENSNPTDRFNGIRIDFDSMQQKSYTDTIGERFDIKGTIYQIGYRHYVKFFLSVSFSKEQQVLIKHQSRIPTLLKTLVNRMLKSINATIKERGTELETSNLLKINMTEEALRHLYILTKDLKGRKYFESNSY